MDRLRHDVAWSTACAILEIFNLRLEEHREAFPQVMERIVAGLEAYELHADRQKHRLVPGKN